VARRVGDWADVATRGRVRRFAPRRLERLGEISSSAARRFRARPYGGRITLLRSEEFHDNVEIARWYGVESGGVDVRLVAGSHRSMLREPDVASLAATLEDCIDAVVLDTGSPEHVAPSGNLASSP
jgi:thioesterase domain-containing protein